MIGYIGAALLAICALPQAIFSVKNGHSHGLSLLFLWSWFLGEVFMLYFVIDTVGPQGPLFWNYYINTVLVFIIVYYRHFPRKGA